MMKSGQALLSLSPVNQGSHTELVLSVTLPTTDSAGLHRFMTTMWRQTGMPVRVVFSAAVPAEWAEIWMAVVLRTPAGAAQVCLAAGGVDGDELQEF